MPRGPKAGRILGDHQALLTDPMEQRGVARRVGHVDAAGQHRDREPVGRQRRAVRSTVDAVGTAGHHRHVPLRQTGGQLRGNMLAVSGGRPSSDDRRGSLGDLVEARRPRHPQRQRWMRLRPLICVDTGERGEGQQRPFGVLRGDQASAQSLQHREISAAESISWRASDHTQLLIDAVASPGRRLRRVRPATSAASCGQGGSATRDR